MLNFDIGKYRNIIISIALFLIFDMSVLVLNFFISFQIADDASSVNLAGRQRMLSQRMTKSLFDMEYNVNNPIESELAKQELKNARDFFDETFNAFDNGGTATGATGVEININQATDENSLAALEKTRPIWVDYRQRIDRVIAFESTNAGSDSERGSLLNDAISFGRDNNVELLSGMNDLTVSLEGVASSRADTLRLIQTGGILLALINFFLIIFHFIRQLREGDKVVEDAKKETDDILATVNEGLFLVHEDFSIGAQRSEKLYDILSIERDEQANLNDIIRRIVSEKDAKDAEGFLRLLFNKKVKEKLIHSLNPLDKIQVTIDNESGGYHTKYLSFDFNRVLDQGEIVELLVTVNDITEKTLLAEQLEVEKKKNDNQILMLTSVLHANPSTLKSYLNNAYGAFSEINNILKQPNSKQSDYKSKIDKIFAIVHNFKGESAALSMDDFADMAHEFEEQLMKMRQMKNLSGHDFLSLTVQLDKLISYAQSITGLIDQLADLTQAASNHEDESSKVVPMVKNEWLHLDQLVKSLCMRQEKKAILVMSGLQEHALEPMLKDAINSICIQFIRNAMTHGIESPLVRKKSSKSPVGRIDIRLSATPNNDLELVIRDDGQGLNVEKIRNIAIGSGQWSKDEVMSWGEKKLLSLIFSSGFSTQSIVDEDAGRGVGMDVILQKIKSQNGKIKISTSVNSFSQFVITFPMAIEHQAA